MTFLLPGWSDRRSWGVQMTQAARIVNTIPSHDVVLRLVVDRLTEQRPPESAAQLAETLRPMYPRVAVFERQLSGERPHLYVYRDGRYEPERGGRWWERPDVACAHVSVLTGQLTHVTGAWATMMRAPADELLGRHFLDFVQTEAQAVAQTMFEAVNLEREVRSEAVIVRPDGKAMSLEFRAVRTGDEIEVWLREIDPPAGVPPSGEGAEPHVA